MLNDVARATGQHLFIVAIAVLTATAAGIPIGVLALRHRRTGRVVLRLIDIIQTIPSLALFGFLIPLPFLGGIGMRTAIVALILYSLLPIVRNTVTGIAGIDPLVREAAIVVGMDERQRLFGVELPWRSRRSSAASASPRSWPSASPPSAPPWAEEAWARSSSAA
jgi:osmoprotectant transport system permease protein